MFVCTRIGNIVLIVCNSKQEEDDGEEKEVKRTKSNIIKFHLQINLKKTKITCTETGPQEIHHDKDVFGENERKILIVYFIAKLLLKET